MKYIKKLKTTEADIANDRYAKPDNSADTITEIYGTPQLLRNLNNPGPCPHSAREHSIRDEI
jgi:hypothetical protein